MAQKRTDLAVEAHELWKESAHEETLLPGVKAREYDRNGCKVTHVEILNEQGSEALGKPVGRYVTVELTGLAKRDTDIFKRSAQAVAEELGALMPLHEQDTVLIAGLGNRAITPDAIGPLACESVMVTRHLVERLPDSFGHMRPVAAITPGVLGTTGMESAEIIRGVIGKASPGAVVMVDALASRKLSRLCNTIQLSDTGIVPGSGVGNARAALNRETLGVPVIAVGVPTVVDAVTLVADLSEQAGLSDIDPEAVAPYSGGLIVTPKDIDTHVEDISRVIGYALNLTLHPEMSFDDVTNFLA